MPSPKDKRQKPAIKRGSRAGKRRDQRVGWERFFHLNTPILPDSLRWVLLIAGAAMILGALMGWPFSIHPKQALWGLGGAGLVIFAFFGVRRTLANVLRFLAKLGL
jgi:hypothetical protein